MKNFLFTLFISLCTMGLLKAQLANGTTAPPFSVVDIDGNSQDLYSYLDNGIDVVMDISATWCGPCWSYHLSGTLENLYNTYGPNGTGEVMVLFVEGDPATNLACLYGPSGCNSSTQGDWVTGTPYPIIHDGGPGIASSYQLAYYPTTFVISSSSKRSYVPGVQPSLAVLSTWLFESFKMAATADVVNAVCGADGSINMSVTAGYGNKTYSWSNGQTSEDIDGLDPGYYQCTITDAHGVEFVTDLFEVGGIFAPLLVNVTNIVDATCYAGNNGAASVDGLFGNGGYSYSWSNGQTGPNLSNVAAGTYTVVLTDALNCSTQEEVVVSQPSQVTTTVTVPTLACGQASGTVTFNTSGGQGGYLYDIGTGSQSSNVFNNVSPGAYNYSIADLAGCDISGQFTISANAGPAASVASPSTITCAVPTVQVDGTGSATGADITYQWSTTDGNIVSGANTITATVNAAGTYHLVVTNTTSNCSSMANVTVAADNLAPTLTTTNGELTCTQQSVDICATVPAGTNVVWNINGTQYTTSCVTVSDAGTFNVVATAANGCTMSGSSTVSVSADLPNISVATPATVTCIVPEIVLNGSLDGDASQYNITWSTSNGTIVSGANTLNPTVSSAGTYTMHAVSIITGCAANATTTVEQVSAAPVPAFSYTQNGGNISVSGNVTGSTTSILWDFGNGTTSTDLNATATYATYGTYNVCLTANNECGANTSCQSVVYSSTLQVSSASTNVSCFGGSNGSITLTPTGGEAPYTVNWTGPNGYTGSGLSISGLTPGIYTGILTDALNSTSTQTIEITGATEVVSTSKVNADSNNQGTGSVEMEVTGGSGTYTYLWSNGQTGQSLTNVNAGSYSCVVTDGNGCSKTFGPFVVANVSGVVEAQFINHFTLSPNPTSNLVALTINFVKNINTEMRVMNSLGETMISKRYSNNISDMIDVSNISAGVYYVVVKGEGFNIARKLVVIK